MIVASEFLKDLIGAQDSGKSGFAVNTKISRPTLDKLLAGKPISTKAMEKVLKATGLELSKAFEVRE